VWTVFGALSALALGMDGMGHVYLARHAAQGKTVDRVIASVPITAFGYFNEAQFYRARRAMYLFTDSKTALKEAVMRTSERVSAYELLAGARRLDRAAAFAAEFERTRNQERAPSVAATEEKRTSPAEALTEPDPQVCRFCSRLARQ
jgi:hypothetical protein